MLIALLAAAPDGLVTVAPDYPNLVTNVEFMALVAGLLFRVVTFAMQKKGWSPKAVIVTLAVILGVGYTAFTHFVDPSLQERVVSFVGIAVATSWAIYEIIWKPLEKHFPVLKAKPDNA